MSANLKHLSPSRRKSITRHLQGQFVAGVYPMLPDETCWFLAVDFDKGTWQRDVTAFIQTCKSRDVPSAVERSRTGNGAHVWFFFETALPAAIARKRGCSLITETMSNHHELPMRSYDRLFPNQDAMPRGGFGNLIALPFQGEPRRLGNSVFIDERWESFPDQWAFLASISRIPASKVETLAEEATKSGQVIGVRRAESPDEEEAKELWRRLPSRRWPKPVIKGLLPSRVNALINGNDASRHQLSDMARNLIVLSGGMKTKERREAVARLTTIPESEERLVVATGRFIGEGFDDARLDDTLFLTLPVSWRGTLVQYAGRLHRKHQAKTEVRVMDYGDQNVPMLARMFEKRMRGYRAMGYTTNCEK